MSATAVYVVRSSLPATCAAVDFGRSIAQSLDVPLTVVDFKVTRYPLAPGAHAAVTLDETHRFADWLRERNVKARLSVVVCRSLEAAIPTTFRQQSVVVLAGRRHWWPTRVQRFRRALEAAGHAVRFTDEAVDVS
jgi:hypothetical protein